MSAAAVGSAKQDARVISLIGVAHGTSHYYQLAFVTMLLIVRESAGLSFEQIGTLGAVFYGASGVGQTLAGFAVDRFGGRPILAGGLAALGLSLGLVSIAHSFWAFAAIAVLGGAGNSVFHPADFAILNASVGQQRLGRAYSIHGLGGSLGWAAAPVMYFLDHALGQFGACLIGAAPGLLMAALVFGQRSNLGDHRVKVPGHSDERGVLSHRKLFLQAPILLCLAYFALVAINTVGIQQFAVPAWESMFGVSERYAATCLIVFVVGSAMGTLVGGFFADGQRHHERVAAIGLSVAAAFTVPVATGSVSAALLPVVLALAGFANGTTGPSRDMIVRGATPPGASGKVFGFVYSGLDIGSFLAPLVFGRLMGAGQPAAMFWIATGLYLLNACMVMVIRQAKAPSKPVATAAE